MRDGRGRSNAAEVRFAGQRIAQRKPTRAPTRIPRRLLGSAALVTVVVGTAIGILPIVVAIASAGLSLLSYLMYWLDKEAAQGGARRIPESTLHLVDLLGGWPGELIAPQQFRHKTVDRKRVVWGTSVSGRVDLGGRSVIKQKKRR